MKQKYILLYLLGTLFHAGSLTAQVRYTATFDRDSLKMEQREGDDGIRYTQIDYPECREIGETGEPSLPGRYLTLLVPDHAGRYVIEMNAQESIQTELENPVYPVQPPVFNSPERAVPTFATPGSGSYTSAYPSELVHIVREGYFDGDKRIVTVRVSPFRYTEKANALTFYTKLEFTLRPDKARSAGLGISPVHRQVVPNPEELARELKFVENRESVPALLSRQSTSASDLSRAANAADKCEYLIITSRDYVEQAEKLAFWKRLKGMTAGVETIEKILTAPLIKGDLVSGIYDDAGKIRQYLKNCYEQRETKYVLLVGEDVPYRVASWEYEIKDKYGNITIVKVKIPTDLYYSDFNGNWNVDKDDWYGEPLDDQVDFAPEIYSGRILCKSTPEFDNYLYKLYGYEKVPGNGNPDYLKKSFYLNADHLQKGRFAYDMSGKMQSSIGFNSLFIFEEKPSHSDTNTTFPHGNEVINEINKNYGFIYLAAHGDPRAITTMTNGYSPDNDDGNWQWLDGIKTHKEQSMNYSKESYGNSIDKLTNTGYPNIIYTNSCETMPFDMENYPGIVYNVGEAFTIMGKFGAAAYIGNTAIVYASTRAGIELEFADALKSTDFRIGESVALSKITQRIHENAYANNLLGCPEFRMWGSAPSRFESVSILKSITNPSTDIRVALNSLERCQANVMGLFGGSSYFQQSKLSIASKEYIFKNVPRNYIVSLTDRTKTPYVAPLLLQNEQVTGRHRIYHVNAVSMGSSVDKVKETGDFVIKNGADVFIEASGEVELDKGFEVEKGASFEISITN